MSTLIGSRTPELPASNEKVGNCTVVHSFVVVWSCERLTIAVAGPSELVLFVDYDQAQVLGGEPCLNQRVSANGNRRAGAMGRGVGWARTGWRLFWRRLSSGSFLPFVAAGSEFHLEAQRLEPF